MRYAGWMVVTLPVALLLQCGTALCATLHNAAGGGPSERSGGSPGTGAPYQIDLDGPDQGADGRSDAVPEQRVRPNGDTVLGISYFGSVLTSFDPRTGRILESRLQLNQNEFFQGLAYDRNHHRLYALPHSSQNLYSIDARSMKLEHIGNLRLDSRSRRSFTPTGLTYDPFTDTLFASIVNRDNRDDSVFTELVTVDPRTAETFVVGRFDGISIKSILFNERDGRIYGAALYGLATPEDHVHIVRIDPSAWTLEVLLDTGYRTVGGLALKPPSTLYAWINASSHFYGAIDLESGITTELGSSEEARVPTAMTYEDFPLGSRFRPIEPDPVVLDYSGVVLSVTDPDNRLGGRVSPGQRFSGEIRYDAAAPYNGLEPNSNGPYGVTLDMGGTHAIMNGVEASILNNYFDTTEHTLADVFRLQAENAGTRVSWILTDPTMRALDRNDTLPTKFNFSKWAGHSFVVDDGEDQNYAVIGRIDLVKQRSPGHDR